MQVKIKQIEGLQGIIDTPVAMGVEYSQSFGILVASTGNEFQTGVTMDFRPFADSVIQVQVNGLTVEGSYTDKLGGFYFSNDGITVKSMADLESGDFLYWNGVIKGYQLEVGDIVTILYEKEYLSYGTSGISGNGSGTNGSSGTSGIDGVNGTSGVSAIWNFMGTYNGNAEYHLGDVVTYEGQTWYALVPNQYMPPDMTNRPNDWKLIVEKGSAGTSGLQGPAGETLNVSGVVEDYNTLITNYGSIIGSFQPTLLTTVILKTTSELYIYDNLSGSADINGWVNMGEIQGPQGVTGENGSSGTSGVNGSAGTSGTLSLTGSTDNGLVTLNGTSPNVTVESTLIYDGVSLKLNAQSGDEGGELFLNKPVTNSSIANGVTIDIYQNKLRFFESGGSARGGYIDITDMKSGVGTNFAPYKYLYVNRTVNQTISSGNWANKDIIFNNIVTSQGIPYDTSTGVATLLPGTYRITAQVAWSAGAAYLLQWTCFDNINNRVGPVVEQIQPTSGSNNTSSGYLDFIFTTTGRFIKIRTMNECNALTGEYIRSDLNTSMIIQQIG